MNYPGYDPMADLPSQHFSEMSAQERHRLYLEWDQRGYNFEAPISGDATTVVKRQAA